MSEEYSAYFKKTVILLGQESRWLPGAVFCPQAAGDPYSCIAEEIARSNKSEGSSVDGCKAVGHLGHLAALTAIWVDLPCS